MRARQQEDLELWREWKKTGSVAKLEALVRRLNPLLYREVNKWKSTVPQAVLESRGRQLIVDALKDYREDRGAAIATYVTTMLRKLSRTAYPYQNVARLPENKQLLFNTMAVAENAVYDREGRDATTKELADELVWTPDKVRTVRQSFGRKEMVESEGLYGDSATDESSIVDFFYHGLPPLDQRVFEDITGYGGRTPLDNARLRSKYNLTQGQLSYKKNRLTKKLQGIQQGKV